MSDKLTAAEALRRETEAAKTLLATYEDILGEDDQAKADMVEGETSLLEAINRAVGRITEIDALMEGIGVVVENAQARQRRLKEQRENLRAALVIGLEIAERRKLETPLATLSLRDVARKVSITNEADIPSKFWVEQDPVVDKKALLAALKNKEEVPGAELDNGGVTLHLTNR
jgi:hypothetical protein